MVMYTNSVPFTLKLEQQGRAAETVMFTTNESDISENTCIEIRENIDVYVLFQSENETCRFYIEGLECIINKGEIEEDTDPYLLPSDKKRLLFAYDQFPLIPGDYCIRVVCETSYYTMLRVLPKQITTSQLQIMKEEIEGFLKGLAYERVQQTDLVLPKFSMDVSRSYMMNYSIVENHLKHVLAALTDLTTHVNHSIKKEVGFVSTERTIPIERIRKQQVYTKSRRPSSALKWDYNLPENRYLKQMVRFLQRELLQMKRMGDIYLERIEFSQEMKEESSFLRSSQVMMKRLLHALLHLQSAPWFSKLEDYSTSILPYHLHTDARYRAVYKMYRQWKKNQDMLKEGSIRFKRTDKLYEIWGFLQFLQVLTKTMCYTPVSGWLYSEGEKDNYGLPSLEGNTKIILQKDSITIHLFYEGEIPLDAVETSPDYPLYTESTSNRPDMRMDIYLEAVYMGSLLFDFKYRPLHHIWDVTRVKYKTATMRKLSQYALSCKSNYLFGTREARYVRPVHEVWAIHPNVHKEYPVAKKLENHDLRIVQLSPTYSTEHIAENLTIAITELVNKQNVLSLLTV
ncbi:nuclease domain-containing protein [Ectobacillus polymachus]|uniref:nuclease domain-containing protein n=1 Tax=Ectobacillus polymachus TaxID=1508806 RepID=UPI003A8B6193